MLSLAWANLTHHKLRTLLSALAVGVGIALMLVSKGLASGSIAEVAERMESVDAELVVLPAQDNIIFTSGAAFSPGVQRSLAEVADANGPLASSIVPVFFAQGRMGDQQQRVFGVDPAQMPIFLGVRRVVAGKLFDRAPRFAESVAGGAQPTGEDDAALNAFLDDGLEMVIDDRLASAGKYAVGDQVKVMGRDFRIVGIVESGVAGRVFAPIHTLRFMLNAGANWSSMYFLKLRDGAAVAAALQAFSDALAASARVEMTTDYNRLLNEAFSQVNVYMNASSGTALVVCFLFILLTMYTTVIERTREIGILKSLGVTRFGLLLLAVTEALLISITGVAIGIGLAFAAKFGVESIRPLLTVDLTAGLILAAVLIGVVGGALSALYPGYRAACLQPAAALSYE